MLNCFSEFVWLLLIIPYRYNLFPVHLCIIFLRVISISVAWISNDEVYGLNCQLKKPSMIL